MSALKIIHLLGSLYPSGMERMLVSAAADFASHDMEIVIVAQGRTHPFQQALVDAGYRVHIIPRVRSWPGTRQFYQVLRRERPDVVHIHTESAFLQAVGAIRFSGSAPIVRTVHSVFRPQGKARMSRRIQAFLADRFVARFISPSPDVARNEAGWGRASSVIFNWVSGEYLERESGFAEPKRDPLLAVMVGNCAHVKNHEMALRSLLANGYRVAHHGDEANASPEERHLLDELYQAGRLVYRGAGAPLQALRQAGVFVLPSFHEGMSVALAEAIACGTPCLVADSTGLSWAKGIDGVQHIPLDMRAWTSALHPSGYTPMRGEAAPPDLSPARGAAEYSEVYRSAIASARAAIGCKSGGCDS